MIRDLESSIQSTFQTDADAWTAVTLVASPTKISFCYDTWLLGGYNILQAPYGYFRRYYSTVPTPHNMIRFSFKFQKIDDWDSGDTFKLQFDSLPVLTGWNLQSYGYTYGSYLCGASYNSYYKESPLITVMVELPHSASDLILTVYNWFDEAPTDESMGFRDITMTFYTLASPPTSQTLCGISPYPLPDRWCQCEATNYYMAPAYSGSCYPCDGTCATCNSATQYNCLSCYPGDYLSGGSCYKCHSSCKTCNGAGQYQCLSCPAERYLTMQKNCISSCPLPLINNATKNFTEYCYSPCTSSQFLYPDMSCDTSTSCVFPMTQQVVASYFLICNFPCPSYQYAINNGSCSNTCPSPLTRVLKYGRLFCNYICSSTQVLYWDGTCDTSCPAPAISYTEGTGAWTRNFCGYPCNSWEYLYWNGSCLTTCPSPLIAYLIHDANFCKFPCLSSQIAIWDGSCSSTCVTSTKPLILKIEGTPSRSFCYFNCEIDEFLYWNGTCSKICIPPLTSTFQNSRSFCGYACSTSQFLNWDGTCVSSCGLPYSQRIEAGLKYCDYNCASPTSYLYWNGSCLATCSAPLTITKQGSAYFCNYGCTSSSDYLYFNGTCASQCYSPLTQRTEGTPSKKFCDYSCSASEYLYWNGTCSSECPAPLVFRAVAGKKYCDYPCSGSQFLYWNSSCLSTCYPPLQIIADGSVTYCVYPCESDEYLNWDGTCSNDCRIPLKPHIDLAKYCLTGCSSSQYLYWDGSCSTTCKAPLRGIVQSGGGNTQPFCYQPCQNTAYYYYFEAKACRPSCPGPYYRNYTKTPYLSCISANLTEESWFASHFLVAPDVEGELTTIRVVKLMEHMRYLDVAMPPRLERLIMSQGRNILSFNFGWPMSDRMQSYFIDSSLPETFAKHGLAASFIVNIWKDLTMMGVIIFLAVVFMVIENICRIFNFTLVRCFFEKCRGIAKWNLVIVFLAMCMDDIVLYSSLQFRSLESPEGKTYDYTYIAFSLLSTIVAVVLNIGLLLGAYFFIYIMRSQSETPNDVFENSGSLRKWQDYQVLFQGYNPSSIYTQTFYLIYVVRVCFLPMVIASYLYLFPLAQTILQVVISLALLAYIVLMKPLQGKTNTIQLIISESLVLIMNICLIIMKAFEMGGIKQNSFSTILLGDFIVGGNVLFNWTWIIFTAIKLLNEARSIYKYVGNQSVKERGIWVELFIIWMQQGSMGFEEIRIRNLDGDYFNNNQNQNNGIEDAEHALNEQEEKETEESTEELNVTKNMSIEQGKQNTFLKVEDLEQKPMNIKAPEIDVKALRSKNSRRHLANSQENIKIQNNLLESRVNLGISDNELPENL